MAEKARQMGAKKLYISAQMQLKLIRYWQKKSLVTVSWNMYYKHKIALYTVCYLILMDVLHEWHNYKERHYT